MAIGDANTQGPLIGGVTPTGIVDVRPPRRGRGPSPTVAEARKSATVARDTARLNLGKAAAGGRGAGRARNARQAGISRAPAARAPTAGGVTPPRARAQANLARGGVPVTRVPTAVPTRVPRPTNARAANIIQQGPAPSQTRAGANKDARQLIKEETERRDRIRKGVGFRAAQALRNR